MSDKRVLIVVTHLLGVGHLARAAAIARGFARTGHAVTLVTGGVPTATIDTTGVDLVQLPAVRVLGTDFRDIRNEAGEPASQSHLARRADLAVATVRKVRPDILVMEQYPFGRRVLRREFDALLEAARALDPRPAVICSLRDVLVAPTGSSKVLWADEVVGRSFDAVLVHGDEAFLPLSESWPASQALLRNIDYTGFVDAAGDEGPSRRAERRRPVVVVTGGGGVAGLALYRAAIEARAHVTRRVVLHCLVGANVPEPTFAALARQASDGLLVERARRDFRTLLVRSALCVSRPGYNTVLDLLATLTPSILIPFEDGEESEQRIRAARLSALGQARLLPEAALTGARLAGEIEAALGDPPPDARFDTNGVANTISLSLGIEERVGREVSARARLMSALDRAAEQGRRLEFWWRDDDAVTDTPALRRLLTLARHVGVNVAVAVIPAGVDEALVQAVEGDTGVDILVHGVAHLDRAPPGVKRYEIGVPGELAHELRELSAALGALRARLPRAILPVLVPPWNRASSDVIAGLPAAGFTGLSMFRQGGEAHPPGLTLVNTHIDPIDWRGGGGLMPREALWSSLADEVEARLASPGCAPIGLLTHHLRHDPWIWAFLDELLALLTAHRAVAFTSARALFSP